MKELLPQTLKLKTGGMLRTEIVFSERLDFPPEKLEPFFVFDSKTEKYFYKKMPASFHYKDSFHTIQAGEASKNIAEAQNIVQAALEKNITRKAAFYAVGGGVVCDITGFAASIFKRGTRLVLVPTSLLAMVDAAVGGKTGIDFGGIKNSLGTFYPAEKVLVCFECLQTLPRAEFKNGLAEIIKIGMINEKRILKLLTEKPAEDFFALTAALKRAIYLSIAGKIRIVQKDFRDTGLRMVLNAGHTFAHALEALTGFSGFSHGEAVAWGIAQELKLGVQLGITDEHYAEKMVTLLKHFGYLSEFFGERIFCQTKMTREGFCEAIVAEMKNDKKNFSGGEVTFALQRHQGKNVIVQVGSAKLLEMLQFFCNY